MEEFRCGFPSPLPQEPVRALANSGSETRIPVWTQCLQDAISTCKEVGIDIREISVFRFRNKPKSTIWSPTLLIAVENNTQKDLWASTLIFVSQMLQSRNALDLSVLIRCEKMPPLPRIFAVEFDNPFLKLRPNTLLERVIQIIKFVPVKVRGPRGFLIWPKLEGSGSNSSHLRRKMRTSRRGEEQREEIIAFCRFHSANLPIVVREGTVQGRRTTFTRTEGIEGKTFTQLCPMGVSMGVSLKRSRNPGRLYQVERSWNRSDNLSG